MIVLKEAFHVQNVLTKLINQGIICLQSTNFMKIKETHDYKGSGLELENKEVESKYNDFQFNACDIADFVCYLISKKDLLNLEIRKSMDSNDLYSLKSTNSVKQTLISQLKNLSDYKTQKSMSNGTIYQKDAEQKQTLFRYNIETLKELDVDKNILKAIVKRLEKEVKETSIEIDKIMVTCQVNFEEFSDNDSFEELLQNFIDERASK